MVHVKALQDRCVAKEGVVGCVRKHNATLMNEQGQYKEAIRTLNKELKEVRGETGGSRVLEAKASRGGDVFA